MNLAEELRAAVADPPPTRIDLDALVTREERRKVRVRWLAAGCATVVAITGTIVGVRLAAPPAVDDRIEWSADRLPDPATLPSVEKVWPDAVHKLPKTLPDGSEYSVLAVLGDDRYLVATVRDQRVPDSARGPSIFDTRAGRVTSLVPAAAGATDLDLLDARVVGDQVVWMQEAARGRELWAARLDGTGGRRLATLADGAGRKLAVAGDTVMWEQDVPGAREKLKEPITTIWRVPLSGGDAAQLPGSAGWSLAGGPWLTTQVLVTSFEAHRAGELWNPATGEKRRWATHEDLEFVNCGPTWCGGGSGGGPREKVLLQRLDGSSYVELPYMGHLYPRHEGRFAVGSLAVDGPTPTMPVAPSTMVIWDRVTGRAGVVGQLSLKAETKDGFLIMKGNSRPSFWDLPVVDWSADDHLLVVDLAAIR
jgi:hypothetical protein